MFSQCETYLGNLMFSKSFGRCMEYILYSSQKYMATWSAKLNMEI